MQTITMRRDTKAWRAQLCRHAALASRGLGRIRRRDGAHRLGAHPDGDHPTYRAFLGVSWLFLISTSFTLAKKLRDAHDFARPSVLQQQQQSLCGSCERG